MRRIATIAVLFISLAACAQYSLVEATKQSIGGTYTVDAQIAWNKSTTGKMELWTADGPGLEAVRFIKGLEDGEALFTRPVGTAKEIKFPTYRANMTESEVMEFVVDSLGRAGAAEMEAHALEPALFGSVQGFRFELTFATVDGLEMSGLAAGATIDEELHLILYTGARVHYFPKYRDDVERLLGSIEMI
jgi:opacity protein-like surface antigen